MKKKYCSVLFAALLPLMAGAQRLQQPMARAVVAVADNASGNVLVTWRKLAQEPENCTYNLYKRAKGATEYTKVNGEPLTLTNFQTSLSAVPYGTELAVAIVTDGVEGAKSSPFLLERRSYKDVFFEFDFEKEVLNPDNYRAKYAWPMDLDGNGEYDALLVDRHYAGNGSLKDPQCDNTNNKLQAYTLDGKCLWTVDMGPNVRISMGQNDDVLAYDINCDGTCEVIVKTSDGTRFWDSASGTWGKYAKGSLTPDTDGDGVVDYKPSTTQNPPYYVSVLNGATGMEMDFAELNYDEIRDPGDQYSRTNRADYMNDNEGTEYAFLGGKFAICYFDGVHPSLAVECYNRRKDNGHHYYVCAWEYDWMGGKPSNLHHSYTWSRNDKTPYPAEFHQVRVADTDGDGIDELLEGGFGVNPRKGMVYSAGIGHGDRFDVSDIDPDRPGMEVFAIQQTNLMGQVLYDAATGEHIKEWFMPTVADVGRGRCMDVDLAHKGYEIFSTMANLYDCKGNVITEGTTTYPVEGSWWDGDLERELLASSGGSGYNTNVMVMKYNGTRLIEFSKQSDWAVHAAAAVRPAFMGDMTGDWREEVVLFKQSEEGSTGLVGYSTDIPTAYSFYALQQDPHYRLDCNTRGYYQMPCTGFYLGGGMPYPQLPPVMVTDLRWKGGAAWSAGAAGFLSFDMTAAQSFADGRSVVFDISGDNSSPIAISGEVKPAALYLMAPKGHDYVFSGSGTIAGTGDIWKSMQGKVSVNGNVSTKGKVYVSEGILELNGEVTSDIDLRARGSLAGVARLNGSVVFEPALNHEGCRLMPGNAAEPYGAMSFGRDLTLTDRVYVVANVGGGKASKLVVDGNLVVSGACCFAVNPDGGDVEPGEYVLAEATGTVDMSGATVSTLGLDGKNYDIRVDGNRIVLAVNATRAPQKGVEWTGAESAAWDYKAQNFYVGGSSTAFVTGDEVVFGNDASCREITVSEKMVADGVAFAFDNGSYTLSGEGGISGIGGLTKSGKGSLVMKLENSDFTGPVVISGGSLTVSSIADGGKSSGLGAATAAEGNLQIKGGELVFDAYNAATDRIVTVADTATINISSSKGALSLKGRVTGSGILVKEGSGLMNFAYPGENPFEGIIVRGGKIGQGEWNSSFCKIGGRMVLEGGEVQLLDMNNSSTRPVFDYRTTVAEGTSNKIVGTTRGAVNGSFDGKGSLTINSFGVRNDIGADFSAFEGELIAQGGNFRLMDNVTDMAKTDLKLDAGAYVGHYSSNGKDQRSVTTKVGALASDAEDCGIGHGKDKYEVGFNGKKAKFAGKLTASKITKKGDGIWVLTGNESTSDVEVAQGTLQLYNSPWGATKAYTSGTTTVLAGGRLAGIGGAGNVVVRKNGVLTAGNDGGYGTLKTMGTVSMEEGAVLEIKVGVNASGADVNDKIRVDGSLTHSNDTLRIVVDEARMLKPGDRINVIAGSGAHSGRCVVKTVAPGKTVEWDENELYSSGDLVVMSVSSVNAVLAPDAVVDVYSLEGKLLRSDVRKAEALDPLPQGVYIVGGEKVVKR